ncbi:hypothetical protein HJFPF1_11158 [Paramyrothecium foliicola]|nr:hypothetical protein HJFPF1_11158 [Paramyrothecium foliicola]
MVDRRCSPEDHGSRARDPVTGWVSLPMELRSMILEVATQEKSHGWSSLASVGKEWQYIIERQNFYRLRLHVPCLDEFERIMARKRSLVRHIEFDIELPRYSCRGFPRRPHYDSSAVDAVASRGICKLFRILSDWKLMGTLTVDLNAYSPSDSSIWFQNCCFRTEREHYETAAPAPHNKQRQPHQNHERSSRRPHSALSRLFQELRLDSGSEICQVEAVTCFRIRRQLRRRIQPRYLNQILSKLTNLEQLVYEPWAVGDLDYMHLLKQRHVELCPSNLPKSLRKISVFEEVDDKFARLLMLLDTKNNLAPKFAANFASLSLNLEELSLTCFMAGQNFFQHCHPNSTWPRLERLALTCQVLHEKESHQRIDSLLQKAGNIALQMPKLQTLVLWNGAKGNAGAFIYQTDRIQARLDWRSTWDLVLSPSVIEVWQRVASANHYCALKVDTQKIHQPIDSRVDAIYHLNLPCKVAAAESIWQMLKEKLLAQDG